MALKEVCEVVRDFQDDITTDMKLGTAMRTREQCETFLEHYILGCASFVTPAAWLTICRERNISNDMFTASSNRSFRIN
jgi:hypothetical protein